jgi:hypothetical protein
MGNFESGSKEQKLNSKDSYFLPISKEFLLNHKRIDPLSESARIELQRIQQLDLAKFSEQDVREEIVTPIIRILGYDKLTKFSVEREKKIKILGKPLFIDYNFTLWEANFWLIEAKKPNFKSQSFGRKELDQALSYAVHPDINAALIVLCDGCKFEIFDREVTLEAPVLTVQRGDLIEKFDDLRAFMEPWQVWFFEKRRVVRLIDKIFDREFNMQRVNEFRNLIDRRLLGKRSIVSNNFREIYSLEGETDRFLEHLSSTDTDTIVDVCFFNIHGSKNVTKRIVKTLVERCDLNSFSVLYKIFPDRPRDANSLFWGHALAFLMEFSRNHHQTNWLPTWLATDHGPEHCIKSAVERLISFCLTNFREDEARATIMHFAAAIRRFYKAVFVTDWKLSQSGEIYHALTRYHEAEVSWGQIVSSPSLQNLNQIDQLASVAVAKFVADCRDDQGEFCQTTSHARLHEVWEAEKVLIANNANIGALLKQNGMGEIFPTEDIGINYDFRLF